MAKGQLRSNKEVKKPKKEKAKAPATSGLSSGTLGTNKPAAKAGKK